ncbi:hypothetical protein WN48_01059 [Eufriesea mexicana]|uniref:uncharacterized protein LOC108555512 n=1 Tax=Eufriesea mexicana TaxID=516756 RepID=UPI00083C2776|nr:PREDICTED: uncharacterized protein LOC108555512 [Eufriesea mexicana]OAD60992.1 hypothetical protein WN48_01059 [Eufriesea mexicana]
MENVYVIKVKTKPALSSLYPSERRYSASTVGGLSFVHFGLGALSLLLGSLALSLQGPILSVACLVPFVTGLLAWRRWYIDRNIAIFFYGSLFSLIAAILCFIATVFDIAAATESRGPLWSFEKILEQPMNPTHLGEHFKNDTLSNEAIPPNEDTFNLSGIYDQASNAPIYSSTPGIVFDNVSNVSTSAPEEDDHDWKANGSLPRDSANVTEECLEMIKSSVMTLWHGDYTVSSHTKILLAVNVLVASLLEAFWSALSARIALRGMMNRLPESSYANGATGNGKLEARAAGKRKSPPPRPDILDHDSRLSENLQNLTALHNVRSSGPRLPLPESSREFRERVERFLTNQAAHRTAEGSCS